MRLAPLPLWSLLLLAGLLGGVSCLPVIQNPLLEGAHPFLTRVGDYFYLLITRHYDIALYKAKDLNEMDSVIPNRVFCFDWTNFGEASYWWIFDMGEMWAPKLHKVDGKWYIYATGWHHRLVPGYDAEGKVVNGTPIASGHGVPPARQFVLESKAHSPDGPYQLSNYLDIDNATHGTVFKWKGKYYFAYSAVGPKMTCLALAPMCNATAIGYPRVTIACPKYHWEKQGYEVNEAPAPFKEGAKNLYIAYSASDYRSRHYVMGLLKFKGGDILNADNWIKSPKPVLKTDKGKGVYGPGAPSITQAPTGEWLLAYHAKNISRTIGLHDENNVHWASYYKTFTKPFTWEKGKPKFGSVVEPNFEGTRYRFGRTTDANGVELVCPNYPWEQAKIAPTYSCADTKR